MAYSTISKPSLYFNTKIYTGTGSSNALTGVGFQPDWTWIKKRSGVGSHSLFDSVRGVTKLISSNTTNAEATLSGGLTAFGTDGFTVGSDGDVNGNSATYASWNWKANGTGSSNSDGSITSTVSVNTTAGFSIVKYTGTNSTGTVGHGLNAVPKVVLYKNLVGTHYWYFTTTVIDGSHDLLLLPATDASQAFSAPVPTNSVLNLISNADTNASGQDIIAYCFTEKKGYSKFGSYIGNGNDNGTFVYCGFKPAFVMYKKAIRSGGSSAGRWVIIDNKRDIDNVASHGLYPNYNSAENTGSQYWDLDMLSNGFKFRTTEHETNGNGDTFFFMAFAAEPLVANVGASIPATAR